MDIMTAMIVFSLVLAVLGAFGPLLIALFPWVGIQTLYRPQRWRPLFALFAVLWSFAPLAAQPTLGTALVFVICLVLAVLQFFLKPNLLLRVLDAPNHIPASAASLSHDERVVGIVVQDVAIAYPLRLLVNHPVINDNAGKTSLLIAWCAFCNSARVYRAAAKGQMLTFEAAGFWRRNLVLRDRQTQTLWQHASGETLIGALHVAGLEEQDVVLCTWESWRDEHPNTLVAMAPADVHAGYLSGKRLSRLACRVRLGGLSPLDRRLDGYAEVAGLIALGVIRAYPLEILRERRLIHDELNEKPVALLYDAGEDRVSAFLLPQAARLELQGNQLIAGVQRWNLLGKPLSEDTLPLRPLAVRRERWLCWSEFQPRSSLYQPPDGSSASLAR
jgi:hypothetical protein